MKWLIILLSGLSAYGVNAQEAPHHFRVEDGQAVWRARLDSAAVPSDYLARLKKDIFEDVQDRPGGISGNLKYVAPMYSEAGYQWVTTTIFLLRHLVSGYATVEFDGGFYNITVRKIVFMKPSGGKVETLEEVNVNRKGNFKPGFRNCDGRVLHVTFSKLFGVAFVK